MCSAAVGVFVSIMVLTTEPVSARSCQEQCDAEFSAGASYCEANFTPGSQEYNDCYSTLNYQYWLCSTGAYNCGWMGYCFVIAYDHQFYWGCFTS
jgi:hypothetical protein